MQATRLENIFTNRGEKPKGEKCQGKRCYRGRQRVDLRQQRGGVRDAAIIASAQRVEHYAMAGPYFPHSLEHDQASMLLPQTLDEHATEAKSITGDKPAKMKQENAA